MSTSTVSEGEPSSLRIDRQSKSKSPMAGGWPPPRRVGPAVRWGLWAGFAAILTLCVVQYSYRHGRLAEAPAFDDIDYFYDGAMRLQSFYDHGTAGLWDTYANQPPHSPFEAVMAVVAFATFGMRDWAPYVLNGVLAFGFFLAADLLLRGAYFWQKVVAILFVATIRIVGMAIHEFRPDFAVVLFTAVGAFLLMTGPFVYAPRRRLIVAGVWFGVAMLTKPPVFPQTIILGCTAILLATIVDLLTLSRPRRVKSIAKAWAAVLLPFILIPLPHYLYNRHHIIWYIREVFFGPFKETYRTHASIPEHLLFYLNGPGGQAMLGDHAWLLVCLLGICTLGVLFLGRRRDRFSAVAVLLFLALAWFIPTANPVKTLYFGLGFQTVLVFSVLYLLGRLLVAERIGRHHLYFAASAFTLISLAVGVWDFQLPIRHGDRFAAWEQQRRQIAQGVFDTIVAHTYFGGPDVGPLPDPNISPDDKVYTPIPHVVLCGIGDINPSLIQYMGLQRQVKIDCYFNAETNKPQDIIRGFDRADFIFCGQSGTGLIADFIPSSPLQDTLLTAVQARPEFAQVGKWTYVLSNGRSLFLFMRREFRGYTPIKNLGDIEGPIPEYDNRIVRWGYGPATTLKVEASQDGAYDLSWVARSDFQGQVVTVKVDGREVATEPVLGSFTQFGKARIPLRLAAGSHEIELGYTRWHTEAPRLMAVLYKSLRVDRRDGQ